MADSNVMDLLGKGAVADPPEAPDDAPPDGDDEEEVIDMAEKKATCPTCGNALDVYEGPNPHKQGTGFCDHCGERKPLSK